MTEYSKKDVVLLCRAADDTCARLSEDFEAEEMFQVLSIAIGMLSVRVVKEKDLLPEVMKQVTAQAMSFIDLCEKEGETLWEAGEKRKPS